MFSNLLKLLKKLLKFVFMSLIYIYFIKKNYIKIKIKI